MSDLVVSEVIRESWQLVRGFKGPILLLSAILGLVSVIQLVVIIILFFAFLRISLILSLLIAGSIQFIFFLFSWYLLAISIMLGVRQSIALPIKISIVYSQCMRVKGKLFQLFWVWLSIIILIFLITHFILPDGFLGSVLKLITYLVSLYFTLPIAIFALPLIVTKQMQVKMALISAFHHMQVHWLNVIMCYVIMIIIAMISAIPLGIGLIWTLPMHFALVGVLFRNVYGLKKT